MAGFKTYQYNINESNDIPISGIKDFLFNTKDGDCVEFSNSLALLGRLAGIPSRVVTGYLASEGLQTTAHLRGLASLYNRVPTLQQFPFEDLFLVTNAHGHSWTQFYIPEYGWLDFDPTSFAIPPVGMGDISIWDVVIPLVNNDENKVIAQIRKFPWQAVLRTIGILAASALLCAYILRYGRDALLYKKAQRGGRDGARALYLLLLSRLAADGKPIKPASRTAVEYSELFMEGLLEKDTHTKAQRHRDSKGISLFAGFAALYTELRWREFKDESERNERFEKLREEYFKILKATRRRGLLGGVIRLFNLRGLAYL